MAAKGTKKSSGSVLKDFLSVKHLSAGVVAAGIATLLSDERSAGEIATRLLELGAPTVVGCTVADYASSTLLSGAGAEEYDIVDGVLAGAVTVGLLMLPGWLPREVNMQVLVTFAIAGGSCLAGHEIAKLVSGL